MIDPVRIVARASILSVGAAAGESRPACVPASAWRRMSHLSRLVAMVAIDVLDRAPVDRDALATVWATTYGEIVTTSRFLDRMFQEGPSFVSPLAFQTSVFGTPLAHLSIALGLTGPSETISAGGASSALAVMRGIDLLRIGAAPAVLVLAGDDLCDTVAHAAQLAGAPGPLGEAVAALLLQLGAEGPSIEVVAGRVPIAPVLRDPPCPAGGLALLASLAGGGSVVERDGASEWTIQVTP